jgi:hypothetical protein
MIIDRHFLGKPSAMPSIAMKVLTCVAERPSRTPQS